MCIRDRYPFESTIQKADVKFQEAIENIDIGGPSMLRSAAKNNERVTVVVEPEDYENVLSELKENKGETTPSLKRRLAVKAFAHTAAYDAAIAAYLSKNSEESQNDKNSAFPPVLSIQWEKRLDLRYGENPHQEAAFYVNKRSPLATTSPRTGVSGAEILQGKALSYNNIMDLDAALACVQEFESPAAVVVKHTNPCGVARHTTLVEAYKNARACDPVSSFGGIVAVNREVDEALAFELVETFLECVVAPSYSAEAKKILSKKKNLRLCQIGDLKCTPADQDWSMRTVQGGILVQNTDFARVEIEQAKVVTKRAPTPEEKRALDMAWRVIKHVKSNAILFAKEDRTAAIGAGQMSRVDSSKIATLKAQMDLKGTVAASDAFFPFRDGVDVLAEAGASCVIQPGGSIRDEEVIQAANEHNMAMVLTGMRHFRH